MTEKRNRWIINTVLILAVIAFVGFSIFPIVGEALKGGQPPTADNPTPTASISAASERAELETRAKGYESVLQKEPDNQVALRELVRIRAQLGDAKGALAPLEKLVQLNPNEPDYAVLLAQVKQEVGDLEGSAQTYRTVLQSKPGNLNALKGFANLLLRQKRPEAAVGLLQDTLKAAPQANQAQPGSVDVVSVQLLLGGVYASQKRYDEAIAVYDEAAKTDSKNFEPILAKALLLKQQGKTEEAKPLFASAANLAPPQYKDQINQLATAPPSPAVAPTTAPTTAPTAAPSPPANSSPAPSASPSAQ